MSRVYLCESECHMEGFGYKSDPNHGLLIAISVQLMTLGLTTLLPGGVVKLEEREITKDLLKPAEREERPAPQGVSMPAKRAGPNSCKIMLHMAERSEI